MFRAVFEIDKDIQGKGELNLFEFSDAWFLTSLIVLNKWSTLKEIVAVGDALNHAIFTQDEIDNALKADPLRLHRN